MTHAGSRPATLLTDDIVFGAERCSLDTVLVAFEALDDHLLDVHGVPTVGSLQ